MRTLVWILIIGAAIGGVVWYMRRRGGTVLGSDSVPAGTPSRMPGLPLAGSAGRPPTDLPLTGDAAVQGVRPEAKPNVSPPGPLSRHLAVIGGEK